MYTSKFIVLIDEIKIQPDTTCRVRCNLPGKQISARYNSVFTNHWIRILQLPKDSGFARKITSAKFHWLTSRNNLHYFRMNFFRNITENWILHWGKCSQLAFVYICNDTSISQSYVGIPTTWPRRHIDLFFVLTLALWSFLFI